MSRRNSRHSSHRSTLVLAPKPPLVRPSPNRRRANDGHDGCVDPNGRGDHDDHSCVRHRVGRCQHRRDHVRRDRIVAIPFVPARLRYRHRLAQRHAQNWQGLQ